ncbi:AAA family ATPase [Pseudanabaena galeata UHCC 0370]|uniref:AAA family ATPase n=1 Tax=Pseudanabaena galeata UHCC 0370 TaxID=3110310 RepID=A0ABU5TGF6_9CYAN|nr:AAA family ATPase [Pseudanabaena galeata]MEA5477123.1 AAA family ATPase [Pseudanabaena galeata UHCC 0370]
MRPTNTSDRLPHIDGYQLTALLFEGMRTLVYRGTRLADGLTVILKMLRSDRPSVDDLLQLRNQYIISKDLSLVGIVQPLSLETYGNGFVIVMADEGYISLADYAKPQPLNLRKFLAIAMQLATILHDLYQQRVIHKDINPSNILIDPVSQQVKITDFELATRLPHEIQTIVNINVLEGTLAYMAPEQTGRMNCGIDYRSDFYALGVTFFELLTGQLPCSSDDPLEQIHFHLAVPAPLVSDLKPELPLVIGQIVAKLMAKNVEERYQSALGLKHDLEISLQHLRETGTIAPFAIATRDLSDRFLIPEKIYGRSLEIQILLHVFNQVAQGSTQLMLVAGFSGVGKTAVINEVHKPIVRKRGYFIKGKFDQLNRNIPFSAFVQAFRDLIGQLLSESDTQLLVWKNKILEALGENGQVVMDVIPELEKIIGSQPNVHKLTGNAAQNRFNLLFQKFIQVFSAPQHPLVIFLDDLQWADSASLQLLQLLMQETGYLLILGAYRDNEISSVHPLMLTVNEIIKTEMTVKTIILQPLIQEDINQLVADTLSCDRFLAQPLTELVYQKAQGNPFFTTQFLKALHEDKMIQFISGEDTSQGWQCDISQIRLQSLTENVVDFMAHQLQKLPPATQEVLKLAACIGAEFDLQTLAIIAERSPSQTATALWKALENGLIIPLNQIYKFFQNELDNELDFDDRDALPSIPIYRFLHDRVQQAAYSLIPESQKEIVHLNIGRGLWERLFKEERELHLFQIVNHLNMGISHIHGQREREELAQLNRQAGEKAKNSAAYEAAMDYLNTGLKLLSSQSWHTHYDLSLSLHQLAVEVAYILGAYAQMNSLMQVSFQNTKNHLDRVKFHEIQILALVAQNQTRAAVDYTRKILPIFGVHLPQKLSKLRTILGFFATLYRMIGKKPKDLLDLPMMSNPYKLAACHLFNAIGAASEREMPEILPFITFTGIALYLRYGNIPKSSMAYTIYAFLLCEKLNRVDAGYAIGKAAIALCHKTSSKAALAPTLFLWNRFIAYRKESLRATLPLLLEAYQVSLEVGDVEYAAYSLAVYYLQDYLTGKNLGDLQREAIAARPTLQKLKQRAMSALIDVNCQAIANLTTITDDPCQLVGRFFDETTISDRDKQLRLYTSFRKLQIAFLFQRYPIALEQMAIIEVMQHLVEGTFVKTLCHFYAALVRLAQYPSLSKQQKKIYLTKIKADLQRLTKLAKSAPMNYQHKVWLLEAEYFRVLGKSSQSADLYDRAITGAKEHKYIQEEALANELAARFYLDLGKDKIAQVYMTEAYYGYVRWGATAKVLDLETQYPQLLSFVLQQANCSSLAAPSSTHISSTNSQAIALTALIKASQSISEEIQLDQLFTTILNTMIVNAGADKCILLLQAEKELQIVAMAKSGQSPQIFTHPIPLEISEEVATTVINRVKRSFEPLVLGDARESSQFAGDRYIEQQQPKSIFCSPIINQGQVLGVLYLENNLIVGAFTDEHLEVLNLLCNQAAISIKHAQIYRSLEQQVEQQSQEFANFTSQRPNQPPRR